MDHLLIAFIVFIWVFAMSMLGMWWRTRLPDHHLN